MTLGISMIFIIWGDTKELHKPAHMMTSVLKLSSDRMTISQEEGSDLDQQKKKKCVERIAYISFIIAMCVVTLLWAIRMASVIAEDPYRNTI
jgi:hypothetical protein